MAGAKVAGLALTANNPWLIIITRKALYNGAVFNAMRNVVP